MGYGEDKATKLPFARRLREQGKWLAYAAAALACTFYFDARTDLVKRKEGRWYMPFAGGHPYILLQVRAFLAGRLAVLPNSLGASNDYDWGRGGMHQQWGLGVPILATPFHLLGRLFGAPGFPDNVRFLILYAATAMALARSFHKVSRPESTALVASIAASGFVMTFPTFVGLLSARSWVYEHTIATGALWSVLLLSSMLWLLGQCTARRLFVVCVAAAFSLLIRPPLAVYGATTVVIALVIARREGIRLGGIAASLAGYAAVSSSYFILTYLRFGSPFVAGFENCLSGSFVNRLNRWGLPFAKVPLTKAAKEMFATLFLLDPVPSETMIPPPAVQPYVVGERWREYYAPTFDRFVFALWVTALVFVCWRIFRRRLWRRDRDLRGEVATVIGAWSLAPAIVLFVFYARIGNMVTRYAADLYPAFAAASVCVGMAIVDIVRSRTPRNVASAQLAIACVVALYMATWEGWPVHGSPPIDRKEVAARIAFIDAHSREPMPAVPDHFKCGEPRGRPPVTAHLEDWHGDCSFSSGMVFAMPHSPCVSFTFHPNGAVWSNADEQSLAGFRANADFDAMVRCGNPAVDGAVRRVTMCEPRTPRFLLGGLRLYGIATLDSTLEANDRLKLTAIDSATSCP